MTFDSSLGIVADWLLLQVDGGRLPACINVASLALIDAGIAMKDMVVSCSAGHVDGEVSVHSATPVLFA